MRPPKTHSRAFTLIELLVVVAIIALLVALLLPALKRAKAQAAAAACGTNLHSLFIAESTYSNEYNGWIGFSGIWQDGVPDGGGWEAFLIDGLKSAPNSAPDYLTPANYLPDTKTLYCPSWYPPTKKQISSNYGLNLDSLQEGTTININWFLNGSQNPQRFFVPGLRVQWPSTAAPHWNLYFARMSMAGSPGTGVMLADDALHYAQSFKDVLRLTGLTQSGTNESGLHARHNNAANILYWDGHVDRASLTVLKSLNTNSNWCIKEDQTLGP